MKTSIILSIIAIVLSSCGVDNTQKYPIVNNSNDTAVWELQHITTLDSGAYQVFYYTKADSLMTYTAISDTIVLINKSKHN